MAVVGQWTLCVASPSPRLTPAICSSTSSPTTVNLRAELAAFRPQFRLFSRTSPSRRRLRASTSSAESGIFLPHLVASMSALNGSRLTSEQKGKQKMGHTDEKKPSQQPNMCGPKFESTAQRLCIGNEEKSSKSIVQEQKMTSAKGASVLKLANRFSALDLENVHD